MPKQTKETEQALNSALKAIKKLKNRYSQLKKSLALAKHQATHDLFTDLPNYLLLKKRLNIAIKTANQANSMFAVIYFSLNEIEKISNGLGHQASVFVIRTVANRFKKIFNQAKKNHLIFSEHNVDFFRTDEFIILIAPIINPETLEDLAENFFRVLDEPINFEKQPLKLTVSMGISLYPQHGQEFKTLLMNADAARLHAKQSGGNKIEIYKEKINQRAFRQIEIENHLYVAIKNNELRLRYQPFIELTTGKICGMEALAYWKNPILGLVSPTEFIPIAEANGMIIPLGEWILRNACAQLKVWHEKGFTTLKTAINLSAKQLQQKNIVQVVANILAEINLMPEYVELELTETEAFKEEIIPIIKQFKEIGLKLSMDDFGTGYSGLKNLKTFNFDKLKIDKTFVQDLHGHKKSEIIMANTIALAKKMNIPVLAEGVETKEQVKFLIDHGCDMVQGYYFSPPLDPDEFTELLIMMNQ